MRDYIKEFGDDQKGKNFILTRFKSDVNQQLVQKLSLQEHSSRNEEMISISEIKKLTTDLVLEFMNADTRRPSTDELLEEQRNEIEQKIEECCLRPGILSLTYHDDFDLDESSIGAMIDPTNTKNWVLLKEEQVYKLPYSYKNALHTFATEVWQKNRDLILEVDGGTESGALYIEQLKQRIKDANEAADARYQSIAHHTTDYITKNPFDRFVSQTPDTQEGHRLALADGQYKMLKKKVIDLQSKLRQLERRFKKR